MRSPSAHQSPANPGSPERVSSPSALLPSIKRATITGGTSTDSPSTRSHSPRQKRTIIIDSGQFGQILVGDALIAQAAANAEKLPAETLLSQHPLHGAHQLLSEQHASSSCQTDESEFPTLKLLQDSLDLLVTEARNTKERVESEYHIQLAAAKTDLMDRFRQMIVQQRKRQAESENRIRLAYEQKASNRLAMLRQELKVKHEEAVRRIMEDIEKMKQGFEEERIHQRNERLKMDEVIYKLRGVIQRQTQTMRAHQVPLDQLMELEDIPDVIETLQSEVKEREKLIKKQAEEQEEAKEEWRRDQERREQHWLKEKTDLQRIIDGSDGDSDTKRALALKAQQEERELEISLIKKELEQDKQLALAEQRQQYELKLQELRDESKNDKLKMKLDLSKLQRNYEKRVHMLQESVQSVTGVAPALPANTTDGSLSSRSKTAASTHSNYPTGLRGTTAATQQQQQGSATAGVTTIAHIMDRQEAVLKFSTLFFGSATSKPTTDSTNAPNDHGHDRGTGRRRHQGKRIFSTD